MVPSLACTLNAFEPVAATTQLNVSLVFAVGTRIDEAKLQEVPAANGSPGTQLKLTDWLYPFTAVSVHALVTTEFTFAGAQLIVKSGTRGTAGVTTLTVTGAVVGTGVALSSMTIATLVVALGGNLLQLTLTLNEPPWLATVLGLNVTPAFREVRL